MNQKLNFSVYIVDDDQFLLDMYTLKFTEAGCKVEGYTDSEQALNKLREGMCPDVLILDLVMPKIDGFELLKQLHEAGLCQGMAVVVLSNQGQESDMEQAQQYGIDGYIIKASTVPSEVLSQVTHIYEEKKKAN